MNKPNFITFTGADDHTDLAAMMELAAAYPIEFGILLSPERQGVDPRYPSWTTIFRMLAWTSHSLTFSAHLCGGHSRRLLAKAETDIDDQLADSFKRIQINTAMRGLDTRALRLWAESLGATAILQCRDAFPLDENVEWLFDASGGRGISPAAWPTPHASEARMGYAGGLNPDNVAAAVAEIGVKDENYWIDMESGVRDENDRFSLAKCRAVCEAVYGRKEGA